MTEFNGYNSDITSEQVQKLAELFPEVVVEGKVDFDRLRTTLGDDIDLGERYGLNWKGKSGVFAKIQEKTISTLHPQPEESVDWDTTQNMFIEGDNLEALKVLHKAYYGKVKMIYIDPPYNTGNDFVYNDDFKKTKREQALEDGSIDEEGNVTRDDGLRVNTGGHKHSNWLDMMYPRLFLARNLLRQDGVIFVSIDDNEVHNLRLMMNEIFGEENFVAQFIWKRRQNVDSRPKNGASTDHEYLVCYSRRQAGTIRGANKDLTKYSNPDNDPKGPWMSADMTGLATADQRPNLHYDLTNPKTGIVYECPPTGWRYEKKRMNQLIENDEVIFPANTTGRPRRRKYLNDLSSDYTGFSTILRADYNTQGTREVRQMFDGKEFFDFPKPVSLIRQLIEQSTRASEDDIILDFFSGSGTTAHAVDELNVLDGGNRRWIMVQLSESIDEKSEAYKSGYKTIAEIARERICRAGTKIRKDFADKIAGRETPLDLGFRSYKLGDSNFKKWNELVSDPEELKQQTLDQLNPLEDNVKDEDLLTEILLKRGISPLAEIETHNGFVSIPSESLIVSLSRNMTEELFATILATKPSQIILLDQAFNSDVNLKTNLILQAEKENIVVEVL